MKILIWNSPFISQGSVYFFYNCFKNVLLLQGNALAEAGHSVDVVFTDSTKDLERNASKKLNKIYISTEDVLSMLGSLYDPNINLYKDNSYKYESIRNVLSKKLSGHYDAIMLWENPVPFLEQMYPDALFTHQMPGAFCRPPYPQFSTFDVYGLYKHGTLYKYSDDIIRYNSYNNIVREFYSKSCEIFNELNIFKEKINNYRKKFSTLSLLPLQVSAHYAFKVDSHYASQSEFLIDVASRIHKDEGLIVTQYVTPNTYDTVMNDRILKFVNKNGNIIWEPIFDNIGSVSQYFTPFVDKIYSVSSSLLFQGFLWNKETVVTEDSCMKPYSSNALLASSSSVEQFQRNTLDFFMNRHQLLSNSLLDPEFLSPLLEELAFKKKSGLEGIERYCDPTSIDKDYTDKVVNSFRKGRCVKDIHQYFPNICAFDTQLGKINRTIKDENIKIISFDIFDTLISRVLEKPVDLFRFLQEKCFTESNGTIDNFFLFRVEAEKESRKEGINEETTLDAIYEYIARVYGLDTDLLDKMKQYELSYELKFSTPHPLGKEIFRCAKEKGKRIILVSDMYLPQTFIEELLTKNGYTGYEKLYVSCELGLSKRKGDIFPYVIEDCGVRPEELLHFGDNKANDIEMAQKAGIAPYYLCNAITRMRANKNYYNIFPPRAASNKARAASVGLIALKNFSSFAPVLEKESLFLNSTSRMGYNALGMFVLSYALWLARTSRDEGLSTLYFLSREGWLIKQVYDIVAPHIAGAAKSEYLYASRRALNVAMIENEKDIISIASLPYANGSIVSNLVKSRFGIDINELDSEHYNKKIEYTSDDRVLFIQICKSLSVKILENVIEERRGYIDYLKSKGCYDVEEMAIVDIGWKGRMQVRLSRILNRSIHGFYYGTIVESEYTLTLGNKVRTYTQECSDAFSSSFVINNRPLHELLICSAEKSLECIKWQEGKLVHHFVDEPSYNARKIFIQELHSGCIDFAADFVKYFDEFLETMFISAELSSRVLASFAKGALPLDAELVAGVNFNDKVGGLEKRGLSELIKLASAPAPQESAPKPAAPKPVDKPAPVAGDGDNIVSGFDKAKPVVEPPSAEMMKVITAEFDDQKSGEAQYSLLQRIEKSMVLFFCSEKKRSKYLRDRELFFADSKNILSKTWYSILK